MAAAQGKLCMFLGWINRQGAEQTAVVAIEIASGKGDVECDRCRNVAGNGDTPEATTVFRAATEYQTLRTDIHRHGNYRHGFLFDAATPIGLILDLAAPSAEWATVSGIFSVTNDFRYITPRRLLGGGRIGEARTIGKDGLSVLDAAVLRHGRTRCNQQSEETHLAHRLIPNPTTSRKTGAAPESVAGLAAFLRDPLHHRAAALGTGGIGIFRRLGSDRLAGVVLDHLQ